MSTYDLSQLDSTLISAGYDQTIRAQVEDYLQAQGYLTTPSATIEGDETFSPTTQLLFEGSSSTINDTGSSLVYILETDGAITVTGSNSVGIALTTPDAVLNLQDSGNDTVYINGGTDRVFAQTATGNDTFDVVTGDATVRGGSGTDYLTAFTTAGSGELAAGSGNTQLDDEGAQGVWTLIGGAGNDTLYGSNSVGDTLQAGSGDTTIVTFGSGANSLVGGSGPDLLVSQSTGNDTLHGGTGDNTLVALGGSGAGAGELISGSDNSAGSWNVLDDISSTAHSLYGGGGPDTLYAAGTGNDTLTAGAGNDQSLVARYVTDSNGNSSIAPDGTGGNDSMVAGANAGTGDSLYAGGGNDTLDASNDPNFAALYSGTGNSTLDGGSGGSYGYFGILAAGSDTITINTAANTTDYVDMAAPATVQYASGDVTGGLPASGSTDPTVTLTFSSGQTIDINSQAGTTVALEFTNEKVIYHG